MVMFMAAGQNDIYEWSRDHRVHHKVFRTLWKLVNDLIFFQYTETDADPHNAKRGFFFAHMGWLMVRKHPEVIEKGKTIDMSDLDADCVVQFQKRYYKTLFLIFVIILPTWLPAYLYDIPLDHAFVACLLR